MDVGVRIISAFLSYLDGAGGNILALYELYTDTLKLAGTPQAYALPLLC